jgi:hypothetical protein
MSNTSAFVAEHVEHSGRIRIDRPLADAFALFTPEGERRWVPGWDPEYLYPPDGTAAPGLTFRTRVDGETTEWLVARFDAAGGEAEYVRITAGSRLGTVSIRCERAGPVETHVWVTYRLTAVSPEGNAAVAAFDATAFSGMLARWEEAIELIGEEGR